MRIMAIKIVLQLKIIVLNILLFITINTSTYTTLTLTFINFFYTIIIILIIIFQRSIIILWFNLIKLINISKTSKINFNYSILCCNVHNLLILINTSSQVARLTLIEAF